MLGSSPNARDRLLPSVRWGLTAALAYLVLFDLNDSPGASELVFVGILLGSNLVASRLDRWLSRERAFVVLLGADSALVLLGLLLADSASQDLVIGYFICVLLAALADSEERLIGLSLLATGLYAFVGFRGGEDLWQPAVLLRFPLLLLVTLSYGLLMTRLRAEQAARSVAERRAVSLEELLDELSRVEQAKTDFLRNLSHEMHTPLHAILGFADIAAEAIDDSDWSLVRRAIERIRERAAEMSIHVGHLLRLSQLTLGRERPIPTAVDLREILARSLEDARHAAAPGALDFDLTISSEVERVVIDGEKLERIVDCLLRNAVKFTDRGRIEVAAALDDAKRLRLSVHDDGIGIPETERSRIFDDFQQGDASTTRRFPGLGLGLAVTRRLVELLGGEIRVTSEAGRGATFEVALPVSLPAPRTEAA